MAFKMKGKSMTQGTSAYKKALVGKQGNLPEELKSKIEAAPTKMYGKTPAKFSQPGAGGPGGDDPKTAAAKAQGREVGEMNKSSKFHPDNKGKKRGAESGFKKNGDDTMKKLRQELKDAGTNVDKRNAVMRKIKAQMVKEGVKGADKPRVYDAETGDTRKRPAELSKRKNIKEDKGLGKKQTPDKFKKAKGKSALKDYKKGYYGTK
tara:strand:- start:743 stop:1360 length:618 start_codon:yes stop_codon:yes gene_type:complete